MRGVAIALVLCWSIVAPSPAVAFVPRAGSVVVVSEPIQDDVYISGGTVQSGASVDGDMAIVGGTVTVTGPVTGSVLAAGGTLTFGGTIGRNLRAAGGTVNITSRIASDAVVAGGTIDIAHNAEIGRDLVLTAGTMQVSGMVQRNAFMSGRRVFISGTILGNTDVRASSLVLLPTASLRGRLRYTADAAADIQPGAQVIGGVARLSSPATQRAASSFQRPYLRLVVGVLETLWLLTLGLVAVALAPRRLASVAGQIRRQFAMSLLVGLVLLVVVPVAAIFLLATVVGIPLSVVTMLLYVSTLYPGMIFTAAWLGESITGGWQRKATRATSPYLIVTAGVLVLVILFALPWLGWIFRFLAMLVGFGAFWATLWNARHQSPAPAAQT